MAAATERRHRRGLIAASVTLAAAAGITVVGIMLPRNDPLPQSGSPVIVALSAGFAHDSVLLRDGVQRIVTAIKLSKRYESTLYTTRVRNPNFPAAVSDWHQRKLVDSAGWMGKWSTLDGEATSTRDEAERFSRAMPPPASIIVVTQRFHTRRACAAFERLGYAVTCVSSGTTGPWWMTLHDIAYESAAHIKYRWKGWT